MLLSLPATLCLGVMRAALCLRMLLMMRLNCVTQSEAVRGAAISQRESARPTQRVSNLCTRSLSQCEPRRLRKFVFVATPKRKPCLLLRGHFFTTPNLANMDKGLLTNAMLWPKLSAYALACSETPSLLCMAQHVASSACNNLLALLAMSMER